MGCQQAGWKDDHAESDAAQHAEHRGAEEVHGALHAANPDPDSHSDANFYAHANGHSDGYADSGADGNADSGAD